MPLFADKLPGNVFEYGYSDEKRVSEFVAAVKQVQG